MARWSWLAGALLVSACRSPARVERPPAGEFQATQQAVVRGVVVDRNGKPLDSVTVYSHIVRRHDAGYGGTTDLTDETGRFSITIDRYGTANDSAAREPLAVNIVAAALPPKYSGAGSRVVLDSAPAEVRFGSSRDQSPERTVRIVLPLP